MACSLSICLSCSSLSGACLFHRLEKTCSALSNSRVRTRLSHPSHGICEVVPFLRRSQTIFALDALGKSYILGGASYNLLWFCEGWHAHETILYLGFTHSLVSLIFSQRPLQLPARSFSLLRRIARAVLDWRHYRRKLNHPRLPYAAGIRSTVDSLSRARSLSFLRSLAAHVGPAPPTAQPPSSSARWLLKLRSSRTFVLSLLI